MAADAGGALSGLQISEVVVFGSDSITLTNAGSEPVSLLGFGLSDEEACPYKTVLPAQLLQPGESVTIPADGEDAVPGDLHAAFRLSSGDTLLLTDPFGARQESVNCAQAGKDHKLVRNTDGTFKSVPMT